MKENETYRTFVEELYDDDDRHVIAELHRSHSGFLIKKDGETITLKVKKRIGGEPIKINLFSHWIKSGLYYEVYAKPIGFIALNRELEQEFLEERAGGVNFPWSPPGTSPEE